MYAAVGVREVKPISLRVNQYRSWAGAKAGNGVWRAIRTNNHTWVTRGFQAKASIRQPDISRVSTIKTFIHVGTTVTTYPLFTCEFSVLDTLICYSLTSDFFNMMYNPA
jgi:hypothetical protein